MGNTLTLASRPWSADLPDLLDELGSDPTDGLPAEVAAQRLDLGRNVLPTTESLSLAALVITQLRETMIVVLLVAAVLTTLIGDLADTLVIAIVVTVNTVLGVSQQRRAHRAIAALGSLSPPVTRLVRSGEVLLVDARDVVPGDVVDLEAGDLVPADGRLLQAVGLRANEATLTGESQSVSKTVCASPQTCPIADRGGMLHAGTAVTHGRARLLVTTTGTSTEVGRLAHLVATTVAPDTPLQVRLASLGRSIALAVAALCVLVLVLGLLRGEDLETMGLTAISLAVAAVPESLPAVVVLSLALAAQRMAGRHAVVRTLPAVEALGAVTVIAADKTGTLTEGTMLATTVWTPLGTFTADGHGYGPGGTWRGRADAVAAAESLARAVVLCNDAHLVEGTDGWSVAGDPMEGALLALAAKSGQSAEAVRTAWPRVAEYGFDHARARMTTVHQNASGAVLVACKGAPEKVLGLVIGDVSAAHAQVAILTGQGLRVLAVAVAERHDLPRSLEEAESALTLLGLVGLHDPPRAAAAASVAACRRAGIALVMITGDHPVTAEAIARELGILEPGGLVITGQELRDGVPALPIEKVQVFARIEPEQKLTIVQALQRHGQVIAMTGDGVNDAPALSAADVGVAMGGSGTEVARQAADVVLVDDDLATLVAAVSEGRRVYDNIRRFLTYGLAGGAAEVLIMLLGPAIGLSLPLLPSQILWVNMLTHGLPGVALGAEQAEDDTLRRPPRDPHSGLLGDGLMLRVLLIASVVAAVSLGIGFWAERDGREAWQSMVLVTLTLQQLGIALALRSDHRSMWDVGWRGNPLLLMSITLNLGLLWLAVSWDPLQALLDTQSLTAGEVAVCLVASVAAPLFVETLKAYGRLRTRNREQGRAPYPGRTVGPMGS